METEMKNPEALLKPEEVAKRLNIGKSTVYHLIEQKVLPGIKIGGALRVRPEALERYLRQLEAKAYGTAA